MLKPTPENLQANAERMGMLMEWIGEESEKITNPPKSEQLQTIADIFGHLLQEVQDAQDMMDEAAKIVRDQEDRLYIQPPARHDRADLKQAFEDFLKEKEAEKDKEDETDD